MIMSIRLIICITILLYATKLVGSEASTTENDSSADECSEENTQQVLERTKRKLDDTSMFEKLSKSLRSPRNALSRVMFRIKSRLKHEKRAATTQKGNIHNGKNKSSEKEPKWHQWTDWAACSVSCGKGRQIRWRHCRSKCDGIETEMEEKACQLPACPEKLFGIIKL